MSRAPLSPRADLVDVEPYVSPQRAARYVMNTNESPYPPPPEVVEEMGAALADASLNRYPERGAGSLHRALSDHLGWSLDGLWIANGSNEVFLHLFLAFGGPGRTVMTFEPTYSLHSLIPRIAGTHVRRAWRAEDLSIDLDEAIAAVERDRPEILMVCSPNNPTGNCEPLDTVRALLQTTPGLVIVDEAYGEFASASESVRPLLDEYRNLALVKTFSKAWSLAGVRLGYLLADPSLIASMERVRLPYHLSTPVQIAGVAALRHASHSADAVRSICIERDRLSVELQALGIKTFPSRANFVLFQVDDADAVWQGLLDRGVLVRNYSDTPGLQGCLRVTAGAMEETDAFLGALTQVLDE